MHVNICCAFQERLTVGRKPESVADLIPEGETILTINVYYPASNEKVSFDRPLGARSSPDQIVFAVSLAVLSSSGPFLRSLTTSDPT